MSAIQQIMLAGRAQVTVTGTLTGSGSLSIPAGVTSISLTGNGSGGTAGTSATYATATLIGVLPNGYSTPSTITANVAGQLSNYQSPWPWPVPSSIQIYTSSDGLRTSTSFRYQSGINPNFERWFFVDGELAEAVTATAYYSATNGRDATPGTAGTATTASIQSQNISFAGSATGNPSPPSSTVQTFAGLSGAASSMTYSVPAGGSLSYSYTY